MFLFVRSVQRSQGDEKRSGSEGSEEDDDYVPYVPVKIRKQEMVSPGQDWAFHRIIFIVIIICLLLQFDWPIGIFSPLLTVFGKSVVIFSFVKFIDTYKHLSWTKQTYWKKDNIGAQTFKIFYKLKFKNISSETVAVNRCWCTYLNTFSLNVFAK